jgi:histidinol dehydrogenase
MGAMTRHLLSNIDPRELERILRRSSETIFEPKLVESVRQIVEDVEVRGDAAVCDALARFDGFDLPAEQLRVTPAQFDAAVASVPSAVVDAIRLAIANSRAFNERVLRHASWREEIGPGHMVGEVASPIDSAGLFVPSGKGSFPSVLVQIGTPAVVAGVRELTVVVPPMLGGDGAVDPAVLVVARELGIERVIRANGPAGIAALAFGTEVFPRVSRVVGPGSPAVTAAQIRVQLYGCSTVMLFGPTESIVVADDNADPKIVAADVLNEAEHGGDSAALLVTSSVALADAVDVEIEEQLSQLPEWRSDFARVAISHFGGAIITRDLEESAAFVNEYAPEHLLVATADPEEFASRIEHAAEILLGDTPFSAGNYVLGVPATLPTGGFARQASGVTARTFLKTSSIAQTTTEALERLAPEIIALAEHEGFPAHAAALRARGLTGD